MGKLVSIVIPTYNRQNIIIYTLELLKPQVLRNNEDVEFIVCNNASTDDSDNIIKKYQETNPFFNYIWYDEHVEVGVSISRSIDNATGKYVLLWGDDDFPCPYLIDILVDAVKRHPEVGLVHFNGMKGDDSSNLSLCNLNVFNATLEKMEMVMDSKSFSERFYMGVGLMSADLFLLSSWKNGSMFDSSNHYGWEFVAPILVGAKGHKCLYINYPLWIQRAPAFRTWQNKVTYFWYIGIPNLLRDLEKENIITSWSDNWRKINNKSLLIHIIPQMLLDKQFYKKHLKEIVANQRGFWGKCFIYFCYYLIPPVVYKTIRNRHFKSIKQ